MRLSGGRRVRFSIQSPAFRRNSFAIFVIPISEGEKLAFSALSPAFTRANGILLRIFMAVLAVSFLRVAARRCRSVEQVLAMGNRPEMHRIDAPGFSTPVRHFQPLWDWPDEVLIGPAVGVNGMLPSAGRKQSVPIRNSKSAPEPTTVLDETDEFQEPYNWRLALWSFRHSHLA